MYRYAEEGKPAVTFVAIGSRKENIYYEIY